MDAEKQTLKSSITNRILAMKFMSEFILIYPLYTIMFGDRGGVSAAGIGTILATGFVLSVVFEVPTGVIGDKIPRKYVLLLAIVSKILALFSWLFLPFYSGYILGTALFALGNAFESGALQAYLYGTLGEESKKNFGRFWARVSAMVMLSYTIAYVLASVIGVKYPLLIILSILACSGALFICLSLPKDKLVVLPDGTKPKIIKSALSHIVQTKMLVKLLLSAVIVVSLAEVVIEYISLYYKQVGVDTRYVPLLMALGNIIGAVLFWTLHSWEKFLDKQKVILMALMTVLFIASFNRGVAIACAGVLIFTRFIRVLQVQFESNIQHLSNDEARVTISSIGSFGAKLVAAGIVVIVGASAINESIVQPLRIALVSGAVVFVVIHSLIRYKQSHI